MEVQYTYHAWSFQDEKFAKKSPNIAISISWMALH